MTVRRPWIVLALLATSCTFVSQSVFEEKRQSLDEDKDGVAFGDGDCDDNDPTRSPATPEIPYDGIDNDCGLDGDLVDIDGDGYPGIAEEDYPTGEGLEPFPPSLSGKPLDCVDDPAVPEAATIFPAPASTDLAYDGVDSNCDGLNDFDVDQDGFLPDTASVGGGTIDVGEAFDAYVARWGLEDQLVGWAPAGESRPQLGDCNDLDGAVNPAPPAPDAWYDGVDTDCDGANDFDQDQDGWMPPALPAGGDIRVAYNQFVALYHDGVAPWALPADVALPDGRVLDAFSDCLDELRAELVDPVTGSPVPPEDVHPTDTTVGDAWYDGLDSNCWADNDFDRDGDAFLPDPALVPGTPADVEAAYAEYVAEWGYEDRESDWGAFAGLLAPEPGDCKDDDPATYPAALETLSDAIDQDCDQLPQATPFYFADYTWDRPSPPRVVRIGDQFAIGVTARRVDLVANQLDEVGLALSFPLATARAFATPTVSQFKSPDPSKPVEPVVDVALAPVPVDLTGDAIPDPVGWFSTIYTASQNGYTYLHGRQLYQNSANGALSMNVLISNWSIDAYTPGSLQVAVNDAGEPTVVGCSDDLIHVIQGTDPQPTDPELEDATLNQGDLCFLAGDPYDIGASEYLEIVRCTPTRCQAYSIVRSATLSIAAGPNTGEIWADAHYHDGLQILLDGTGVVVRDLASANDLPVLDAENVLSADAVLHSGTLYVAAVVDTGAGDPEIQLLYGSYPTLTGPIVFPFQNPDLPDLVPEAVALHADGDRVMIAVTARDRTLRPDMDAVGWAFLAP